MFWKVLFVSLFAAAISGIIYITVRFHHFGFVQKFSQKSKLLSWIVSLAPVLAAMCFCFINIYSAVVVLLHLILIWIICDLFGFVFRKFKKNKPDKYYAGFAAIVLTAVYMSYGWFCAHHVFETDYSFETEKNLGADTLRVAEIADAHIGITLDGKKFSEQMEKLQQANPDVVVVAGDFVDDDSFKADMIEACRALGSLKTKYGVYFVFGNHDKGYYNYRDFNSQDLRFELEENGIVVLEDESVLIEDSFYIIGRQDRSENGRAEMSELTSELDKSKYMIVIDHQPNDYSGEAAAEVDLVLSGHTHGGHIFPAGFFGLWMNANDRVYGSEVRGSTVFVVSSGISGWAIPFKTGTISEFVIVDIKSC